MSMKNIKLSPSLPTAFARQIAIGVDLLPSSYDLKSIHDYEIDLNRLAAFQQLAIAGSFDDAMLAYHGLNFDEEKLAALQLIYNTTKPWIMGHVMGEMLFRMEAAATGSKEALEIAAMFIEHFGPKGKDGEQVKKGLLLRFTGPVSMETANGQN